MSRMFRAPLWSAVLLALSLVFATTAVAAPITWKAVDVVLHDDGAPLMIVAGTVPDGTTFPAEGELTGPTGATLSWSGEVLGGALDQDPSFTPTIGAADGFDIYRFTVTQGPSAQLELSVPSAIVTTAEGTVATISWIANQDLPLVNAMIRMPAGASISTGTPDATIAPGPSGYQFFQISRENVKSGDVIDLSVTYQAPAGGAVAPTGTGTTTTGSNSGDTFIPALLIIGFVGAAALFIASVRRKMAPAGDAAVEFDDEDADTDATPAARTTQTSDTTPAEEPTRSTLPKGAITAIVGVVFVVVVVLGIQSGTKSSIVDGVISTQIAQVDQCTSSTFPVVVPDGESIEDVSDELFDALRTTQGIGLVKVYVDDPRIEVGYCESSNNEPAIAAVLAQTGYVSAQ